MYHNITAKANSRKKKMIPLTEAEFIEKMKHEICGVPSDEWNEGKSSTEFDAMKLNEIIYAYLEGVVLEDFPAKACAPFSNWPFESESIYTEMPSTLTELAEEYRNSLDISKLIPDIDTLFDSEKPLLGYQNFDGLSFIGFLMNDCERSLPIYIIFYWDGKVIKYYIPVKGNVVYEKDKVPFGSYYLSESISITKDNLFKKYGIIDEDERKLLEKMFIEELSTRVDKSQISKIDVMELPIEIHWTSIKSDISETFAP